MNYLLDTCTLIWALAENEKLSKIATEAIASERNVIHVSAISLFEISLKGSIGKLAFSEYEIDELPALLYDSGIQQIPLDPFDSIAYYKLPLADNHRDPFDRMIVCQAIERNLTLLSRDRRLSQYCEYGLSLLW